MVESDLHREAAVFFADGGSQVSKAIQSTSRADAGVPHGALVPRTRSSHHDCCKSDCELRVQSGTSLIGFLVFLGFRSSLRSVRQTGRTSESGHEPFALPGLCTRMVLPLRSREVRTLRGLEAYARATVGKESRPSPRLSFSGEANRNAVCRSPAQYDEGGTRAPAIFSHAPQGALKSLFVHASLRTRNGPAAARLFGPGRLLLESGHQP